MCFKYIFAIFLSLSYCTYTIEIERERAPCKFNEVPAPAFGNGDRWAGLHPRWSFEVHSWADGWAAIEHASYMMGRPTRFQIRIVGIWIVGIWTRTKRPLFCLSEENCGQDAIQHHIQARWRESAPT
jgi:hypothetical protein